MLQRLGDDEKDPMKPRRELDNQLGVTNWRTSRVPSRRRRATADIPDNAPSWWQGDEDASQSFLQAMRIVTTDGK
jgi:hypothetical protein